MADKTLKVKIVLKNDVATTWKANNPVLLKGEIGIEIDTDKYKIGDGTTDWNTLPYFSNLPTEDKLLLDKLIKMLNEESFGKVNDVKVNNTSVLGEDKIANIVIGELTFSNETQLLEKSSFTNNIVLHKIAKSGDYNDLINKLTVIDNLDSNDTKNPISANQANILKKMVQAIPTAISFSNIKTMVEQLNLKDNSLNIGSNIYLQQIGVPDFWIYSKELTSVPYTYTSDEDFINAFNSNGFVQVGYYKLSLLETAKVDLTNYYTKEQANSLFATITNLNTLTEKVNTQENSINTINKNAVFITDSLILDGGDSTVKIGE